MNNNQLENIKETLKDFKALLPRYKTVEKDIFLLKKFCSRNRNPLFDISQNAFFETGLKSHNAKSSSKTVKDHYIQRAKAIKLVFEELKKEPQMDTKKFIFLLKKYCSTVELTKDEHTKVTQFAKKNPNYINYESYLACGIEVSGLSELILS